MFSGSWIISFLERYLQRKQSEALIKQINNYNCFNLFCTLLVKLLNLTMLIKMIIVKEICPENRKNKKKKKKLQKINVSIVTWRFHECMSLLSNEQIKAMEGHIQSTYDVRK